MSENILLLDLLILVSTILLIKSGVGEGDEPYLARDGKIYNKPNALGMALTVGALISLVAFPFVLIWWIVAS